MNPLTLNDVLSREPLVTNAFLDTARIDRRWASHICVGQTRCCPCCMASDAVEVHGEHYYWCCPRYGVWLLLDEDEPLPTYLYQPFEELLLAEQCGIRWGDYIYEQERAEYAALSAAEKAAKAAALAAADAKAHADAAAAAALAKKEYHAELAKNRFKHGDFTRVLSKRTGLPVQCKWDSQPAGNGFEAGCADHRNHVCPFFHSDEPEWADAIPAARGDYVDPRFIGLRAALCDDRRERRAPQQPQRGPQRGDRRPAYPRNDGGGGGGGYHY